MYRLRVANTLLLLVGQGRIHDAPLRLLFLSSIFTTRSPMTWTPYQELMGAVVPQPSFLVQSVPLAALKKERSAASSVARDPTPTRIEERNDSRKREEPLVLGAHRQL